MLISTETCNDKHTVFASEQPIIYLICNHVRKFVSLSIFLDNIFIKFGPKLYRQTTSLPMGTTCDPLAADFVCLYLRETF